MLGAKYLNIVVLIVIIISLYVILNKFGLLPKKKTKEERRNEAEFSDAISKNILDVTNAERDINENPYFNPSKWKESVDPANLLKTSQADEKARKLYRALHKWGGDDEEAIYGVFRSLKSPYMISQIANAYNSQSGGDLASKMIRDLDNTELAHVQQIISQI